MSRKLTRVPELLFPPRIVSITFALNKNNSLNYKSRMWFYKMYDDLHDMIIKVDKVKKNPYGEIDNVHYNNVNSFYKEVRRSKK